MSIMRGKGWMRSEMGGRRKFGDPPVSRRREYKGGKDGGGSGVLVRVLVGLCVVSSMALVLQLNLTNQHNLMLKNIKGVDEPRGWSAQPARPTCRPQRHLVFLKTHKCGSSTLQNLFMKYADANNLSVALPAGGVYLDNAKEGQGLSAKKLKESPLAPPSGIYHFLIHHTRLNVRAIQQVTYDDSVWVTVVREPSAVFESLFHYYHLSDFYGATFDHLVWKLEGNDRGKFKLKNSNNRYGGRLGRNQMSFDLGLEHLDTRLEEVMKEAITLLDNTFHLVMIAERMDESLVLLKHLMCWRDEDMVAITRNVRKDRYRSYLSQESVATLERFNAADVKLYSHFVDRFDKQVEEFGRARMEEEVAQLKENRDKVWRECGLEEAGLVKQTKDQQQQTKQRKRVNQLVVGYEAHTNGSQRHREFCKYLVRPSSELTQAMRHKQYHRYHQRPSNPWNITFTNAKKKKRKKKAPRRGLVPAQNYRSRFNRRPQVTSQVQKLWMIDRTGAPSLRRPKAKHQMIVPLNIATSETRKNFSITS